MEDLLVEIVSIPRSKELGLQYLRNFPYMEGDREDEMQINFYPSKQAARDGAKASMSLRFHRLRDMTEVFAYLS